jgi:uncharacterized lipoprotein
MMNSIMNKIVLAVAMVSCLASCAGVEGRANYPKTPEERRAEELGKITGEGLTLGGRKKESAEQSRIGVNGYLWQATLDTIYNLPVKSADPFAGIIMTDWYKLDKDNNVRYSMNVYITSPSLKTDAVKVSVFKQQKSNGKWGESVHHKGLSTQLENEILLKARSLKYESMR